jgi:hypothetical protein
MFEMIGNFDKGQEVLEGAQLATAIGLCKAVMALMNRGSEMVRFHRDMDTKGKTCPGSGIDFYWFLGLINQRGEREVTREEYDKLSADVALLKKKASMPVPSWAKDAVAAAVKAGIIDTPNGRSEDFYSLLAILHRKGMFSNG